MKLLRLSLIVLLTSAISGSLAAGAAWLFFSGGKTGTGSGRKIGDFALLDQAGRYHQLYKYTNAKAIVLFSYGISCPQTNDTLARLSNLKQLYAEQGVEFFILHADPRQSKKDLQQKTTLPNIGVPILRDDSQLVSEELGLLRSGETVLLDPGSWRVRYRGPIDDRSPGQPQDSAVNPYLENAIEAVLGKKQVAIPMVAGKGCLTEFADNLYLKSISYTDKIAPILKDKCIACHRSGGIAPWSMDNYESIKEWSARIQEVVMTRKMPPWHADPQIGEFSHDRSLTIEERQTLIQWIKLGSPRAEKVDPLAEMPTDNAEEWSMGKPDLVIDIPQQKLPAEGVLPYRWVKIPIPVEYDSWVRAIELRPSNSAVMHHGFVFVNYPKRLKSSEPRWLEGRNGFFVAYVPGVTVHPLPENSGQLLPTGGTLIFQLHYVTNGSPTADNPKLALYFHETPPAAEYKVVSAANMDIRIPPYIEEHEERAEMVMEENGKLQGFYPHMHYRGKRFQYQAIYPDGRSEKLLSVPKYDIHWQTFYRLKDPKILPAGTRIVINAAFDNSTSNPANPDPSQEVKWGLKSTDEMLVGYFMYTRKRQEPISIRAD